WQGHGPTHLRRRDELGVVEHVQMLHHRRQLDRKRPCQLAHGSLAVAFEAGEDRSPRWVDERRKGSIKPLLLILHHMVNCLRGTRSVVNSYSAHGVDLR